MILPSFLAVCNCFPMVVFNFFHQFCSWMWKFDQYVLSFYMNIRVIVFCSFTMCPILD